MPQPGASEPFPLAPFLLALFPSEPFPLEAVHWEEKAVVVAGWGVRTVAPAEAGRCAPFIVREWLGLLRCAPPHPPLR